MVPHTPKGKLASEMKEPFFPPSFEIVDVLLQRQKVLSTASEDLLLSALVLSCPT